MSIHGRPTLVFDGACGFCTLCVQWLRPHLRREIVLVPWQAMDPSSSELDTEALRRSVWWLEPDGRRYAGHRAVAAALQACGGAWTILGKLLTLPVISWLAAAGYALVARLRRFLPGIQPSWPPERPAVSERPLV